MFSFAISVQRLQTNNQTPQATFFPVFLDICCSCTAVTLVPEALNPIQFSYEIIIIIIKHIHVPLRSLPCRMTIGYPALTFDPKWCNPIVKLFSLHIPAWCLCSLQSSRPVASRRLHTPNTHTGDGQRRKKKVCLFTNKSTFWSGDAREQGFKNKTVRMLRLTITRSEFLLRAPSCDLYWCFLFT